MISIFLNILAYAGLIYFSLVGGLFLSQRDLIYFPTQERPLVQNAGIIGLEEISVRTQDGLDLYGWYKPSLTDNGPVLVWFHGNASNIGWSASRAKPYIDAGYGILLTEYRGYSRNPGKPSEDGLYQDARAFLSWLEQQDIMQDRIILYGESIGSGPAVQMALEYPGVRALVLESPFTSLLDIASSNYPFIPVQYFLKDRYDNLSKIKSVTRPTIFIHGAQDSVVPYSLGKRLFEAANEPKTMITIPDGDHNTMDNASLAEKVISSLSE